MKRALIAVGVVVAIAAGLFKISKLRTYQLFGEIVPRVETDQRVVALTFDDGPAPPVRELLDTLDRERVRATFFLIGDFRAPYGKKLVGLPWYLWRHHRLDIMWDVEPQSDPIIDGLRARGLAFVTVQQLLALRS